MPLPLLALLGIMGGTAAVGAGIGAARRSGKKRNPLEEELDAQEIDKGPDSAFLSALETIGRPGHMINNALVGNFEGVGRQGVDLLGDAVDALLPGDWIPHISRRMDKPGFSDVLGGMDPGFGKTATDIVGGIATDPTNLIPAAAIGKGLGAGANLVKQGVAKLPTPVAKGLTDATLATKETLGWLNPAAPVKKAVQKARSLRGRSARAGATEAERIMSTLPESAQVMVGDVIDNLTHGEKGAKVLLAEKGRRANAIESIDEQLVNLRQRLAKHPDYADLDDTAKTQVNQAIEDSIRLAHNQYMDDLAHGALARPVMYTDEFGKRFYKDELEDAYRAQKAQAEELVAQGDELAGKVRDLDQETIAANRIANQTGKPMRGEFQNQVSRERELTHGQAVVADQLDEIDPGKFKDFIQRRGLKVEDVDVSNASPRNYLQRLFEFPDDAETAVKGGLADAQKSRKFTDDESLARYLNENPDVKYERNAYKRLLDRSGTQGRMLEKATIARQVLGDKFTNLVDGIYHQGDAGVKPRHQSTNAAVDEALNAMAKSDPESARVLANAYHGTKARGPVLELLAKANKVFKPAAVFGIILPKMGSIVRNDLGTSWQILSTQGAKMAGKNLARTPRRLWDAINDGTVKAFGWKHIKPGDLTKDIDAIEAAYRQARGGEKAVVDMLTMSGRHDLAQAVEHGVLEGFVSSEQIMSKTAGHSWWKKKFFDLYDAPAAVFQGVEQRARLGNFLDQFRQHGDGAKAADQGREALLDYSIGGSVKNRTLRDIVPFAAFLAGSTKQQSKFLAQTPGVAGALSRALEQDPDQQVYPYMEGKLNIPIGKDTEGNAQFVSGFGLPFEALQSLPNPSADLGTFGRQVEQSVIGSTQPLLKSAFAAVAGEDPYFGTPYGSYSKAPVIGEAGDAGRAYNKLAGSGLIQPIDTPLRLIDDALDPRHGPLAKGIDLLTGANVVSVDPDRALQQRLQQQLETNPQVAQHRSFYDRSGDPETEALLQAYNAAKARLKTKRKAQEAASASSSDPGSL